jgi:hypothetical protein
MLRYAAKQFSMKNREASAEGMNASLERGSEPNPAAHPSRAKEPTHRTSWISSQFLNLDTKCTTNRHQTVPIIIPGRPQLGTDAAMFFRCAIA